MLCSMYIVSLRGLQPTCPRPSLFPPHLGEPHSMYVSSDSATVARQHAAGASTSIRRICRGKGEVGARLFQLDYLIYLRGGVLPAAPKQQ